jgi:diguanylate cyclase (GGDEF)-like protein
LKVDKSHVMMVALKQELIRAQEAAKQWQILAMTDDLTGLYNRRMIYELDKEIGERRDLSLSREVALLFIDLDDFGKINKDYGDDVGDEALRLVGKTIRENIRCEDIAIRKGGDEFVIILIGCTEHLANGSVGNRLNLMLNGGLYLNHANISIPIRGSMGVFDYNDDITPFQNLKHADELMRAQKKARKAAKLAAANSGDDKATV